jgi:hypothetical protein
MSLPSSHQNAHPWSFAHLSPDQSLHLNSRHNPLSPLHTPSGSFESLWNIPPGPLPLAASASGNEGFSHYSLPQAPSMPDLHASYGGPYTTPMMQALPPQNLHMLRTMWEPPQHQSDAVPHSPAGFPGHFQPIMMQPGVMNVPFQNTTAAVVNAASVPEKRGRKRKNVTAANGGIAPTRKRQKTNTGAATTAPAAAAAVCDVGPVSTCHEPQITTTSTIAAVPTASSSGTQVTRQPTHRDTKVAASDVWYFMWAVDSSEKPAKMPEDQPRLMNKPDSPYVACRLCG